MSVVVPTFQRREPLRRLLEHLDRQSLPPTMFEVVVGVDGSTDGTIEMLESYAAPYACAGWLERTADVRPPAMRRSDRRGRACSSSSTTTWSRPSTVWRPTRGARRGRTPVRDGRLTHRRRRGAAPHMRYVATKFADISSAWLSPPSIPSQGLLQRERLRRTEELLDVGLFDERFRTYGNEDLELAYRLVARRMKLAFSRRAAAAQRRRAFTNSQPTNRRRVAPRCSSPPRTLTRCWS